jgi:Family of unknown function (DUF6760)
VIGEGVGVESASGTLPGGYWDAAGTLHQQFELVPLSGSEEELLVEASGRPPVELVTTLLSRCVIRLGEISPVPESVTRELLVGDRHYLMLRLRQATFGDSVLARLLCPWADCGKPVQLDFSLTDVPVAELVDKGPHYRMRLLDNGNSNSGQQLDVVFRLPTGADQEEVTGWVAVNEAQALTVLLQRCIQRIGTASPPSARDVEALAPQARAEIEAQMGRIAPSVEQTMETDCVECGRTIIVPLDIQRFFFGELRVDRELLYQEVHYLAYHYHWGERDILSMTREKRRRYIDVLAAEIERMNSGG